MSARGQERQICGRRAMPVVPPLATKLLSCGKRTLPVGNSGAYDHRSRCANASPASSADLTRQDIIQRTDGIPLFVEEMTKAVLEAEGEGAVENAVATIPSPSIGVPASLHASRAAPHPVGKANLLSRGWLGLTGPDQQRRSHRAFRATVNRLEVGQGGATIASPIVKHPRVRVFSIGQWCLP